MKKQAPKPKAKSSSTRPKKPRASAVIGRLIASPAATVNAVMQWLNNSFGLHLPTLPLQGWPAVLVSLWDMFIEGDVPSGPLPWKIPIQGGWPAIFPQVGSPPLMLEQLTIHVEEESGM
jgi:hypothetical protein